MSTTARDHGFRGDENLYGLGIRIGYYLLWAAVILSGQLGSKYVFRALRTLSIFQIAILITAIWKAATLVPDHPFYSVEAYLVSVFIWAGALTIAQYDAVIRKSPNVKLISIVCIVLILLWLCFDAYTMWFWFRGVKTLTQAPGESFAFFFAKVRLTGWFMTFSRVVATCSTVITIALSVFQVLPVNLRPESSTKHTLGTIIAQIILLVLFILAMELTIKWNGITGVSSLAGTTQLIPFITGIVGLARVPFEALESLEEAV